MRRVLVTGSLGQIGSELALALCDHYGADNVITSDIRPDEGGIFSGTCAFERLDVLSAEKVETAVKKNRIDAIYHLAAVLSAIAEKDPQRAWKINMDGLYNILETARANSCSVFFPSSIGVFGPSTPLDGTPQETIMRPHSMYGITKLAGEVLCDYYFKRYGVDTRGVRFPGIISNGTLPGGGTTDYAVEIFYAAVTTGSYTCFLKENTSLDMMYMPDAIKAAIELMEAEPSKLEHRNAFNVTAMHLTPADIAEEIGKHIPGFAIQYDIDPVRQAIADSWPNYMDDTAARREWGWNPEYDLATMTEDMLKVLRHRHKNGELKTS
jgi:nucleoside-diphosphate-sugar epimerase